MPLHSSIPLDERYHVAKSLRTSRKSFATPVDTWKPHMSRNLRAVNKVHKINFAKLAKALIKQNGGPIKILEVGPAYGVFATEVAEKFKNNVEIFGIDPSRKKEWAALPDNVHFHVGHAENVGKFFKPNSFDIIISTYGLFYAHNQPRVLEDAHELLRDSGLLITTLNRVGFEGPQIDRLFKLVKGSGQRRPPDSKQLFTYCLFYKKKAGKPFKLTA